MAFGPDLQVSQSFSDKLNSASQHLAEPSGKLTLKSSRTNSVEMAEMATFLKENRLDPSALAIAIRNGTFVRSFTDGKRVTYRLVTTPRQLDTTTALTTKPSPLQRDRSRQAAYMRLPKRRQSASIACHSSFTLFEFARSLELGGCSFFRG